MKRFARLKMLASMVMLACIAGAAVVLCSPYDAVIVPAPENIEEIWAIEDTRAESAQALVTRLENHGQVLGYDAESNTFYCTLGVGNEDGWPDIHLTAPDAKGVRLCFVDDYTYDGCSTAIAEGYAYELMAYTDTEYAYFNLVFTALPQLCMDTRGQEIADEDVPIRVWMVEYGKSALESTGRIHLRGASTRLNDKKGYKIEFTHQRYDKEKKTALDTPVLGVIDQIVLLPCAGDETRMRDKLSWDLYAELAGDDESFGARRAEYVELFRDDEYLGLYLMMEPVDAQAEVRLSGDRYLMTDSVYRTATMTFAKGREVLENPLCRGMGFELYYMPQGRKPFSGLEKYMNLMLETDDAAFCAQALEHIDVDSLLRHVMLIQAGGMTDNVFNNMYIWAHEQNGKLNYRHACWDMDWSWGLKREEIGEEYQNWLYFPVADRLLNLNADGIRETLREQWTQLRATVFEEQRLEERIAQYDVMLRDSGAWEREEERWNFEAADGYEIVAFASQRWPLLDEAISNMAQNPDERISYLESSRYGVEKGASMI